jgi:hypothetical protein
MSTNTSQVITSEVIDQISGSVHGLLADLRRQALKLQAQAGPALAMTETITKDAKQISRTTDQINDAINSLERLEGVPEATVLAAALRGFQPILTVLTTVNAAQAALAALTVPDPIALASVAGKEAVGAVLNGLEGAFKDFLKLQEKKLLEGQVISGE